MKVKTIFKTFFFVLLLLNLSSCRKDSISKAPAIPSESTMNMDFTFTNTEKTTATSLADSSNFIISNAIVKYWKLVADANIFLPALSIKAVIAGGDATYDEETKTWKWIRNFNTTSSQSYLASLTGIIAGDSVSWVMNIQKIGENNPFKYFEGVSTLTKGWWKIYARGIETISTTTPALKIKWEKTNGSVSSLKYTNIIDGDANNGSYIEYGKLENTTLDRYFKAKIMNLDSNNDVNGVDYTIEWSSSTREGDIQWDGNQGCWDTTLKNTDCK